MPDGTEAPERPPTLRVTPTGGIEAITPTTFVLTPMGWAFFGVMMGLTLFYFTTPSPGPRVGRILAILGPRPRSATIPSAPAR